MDADYQHTTITVSLLAGGFINSLQLNGIDPSKPYRHIFINSDHSGAGVDFTGLLQGFYQGKKTFEMPLTLQSGAALATTRPLTGGILMPARDTTTQENDCWLQSNASVGSGGGPARVITPISAFVTLDSLLWTTVQKNSTGTTGFMRMWLACRSWIAYE